MKFSIENFSCLLPGFLRIRSQENISSEQKFFLTLYLLTLALLGKKFFSCNSIN